MPPDRDRPEPFERDFPPLPILSADEVKRSQSEKYGSLFYLGIGGLAVLVLLVSWFGWSAWSLRHLWANVYTLHDPQASKARRIEAAYALAHDPAANQRQLWDITLRRSLPALARFVVAESLTAEAVEADPRGYALAVAKSEGWPDWLRLILLRPIAYRSAAGLPTPVEPVAELTRHADPGIRLWALYSAAAMPDAAPEFARQLRTLAETPGSEQPLARMLVEALDARSLKGRTDALDRATVWLRRGQPSVSALWQGWEVRDGKLVPQTQP
ncbi:MAG: hypothetical protein U0835_09585 [Isosphaeraceae bacterium]